MVSKHRLNIPYYNTDHHPCAPCCLRPADAVGMVRHASQSPAQSWEASGLLHIKPEMAPHTWNFIWILDSLAHPNTCWASGILGLDRSHIQGAGWWRGHSPGWGFSVLYRCPSPLSTEALLATVRDSPHQPQTASCDQAQQLGHAGLARWSPRTATQCPHPCSGPRPSSLQPPPHPLMGISPVSRTGCHPRETVAGHISLMGDSTPGG